MMDERHCKRCHTMLSHREMGDLCLGCESVTGSQYPTDWPAIARRIKDAGGWICERCKHPHDVASAHVLTVHHLDGNKANCADWNLAALCQRCHLTVQGRVQMHQGFMPEILPVSEWFRPHLAGYLASLSNDQAEPRP